MHIVVQSYDLEQDLTIEVKRVYSRGCVNDYGLKDKTYMYFQYDCHDRPNEYKDEYKEVQWFRGYLIGKKVNGNNPVTECRIQVKGK